ncbi:MAG: hypothetical protein JRG76_03965 [Deltaproteobacteria bacterium]|nr:hypothetical protein [Deltaproteobacteria bacterium]
MGARTGLGLRVHTGWATAVVLRAASSPGAPPEVADRRRLELADPAVPESKAPYHEGLERKGARAEAAVERGCKAARAATLAAIRALVQELTAAGLAPAAVALVVGSDGDPSKIANPHVRAHASEGRLYRDVLEEAAEACGLDTLVLVEKELWGQAEVALGPAPGPPFGPGGGGLKHIVTGMGASVGRPWRAEEKAATVAAWLALEGQRAGTLTTRSSSTHQAVSSRP